MLSKRDCDYSDRGGSRLANKQNRWKDTDFEHIKQQLEVALKQLVKVSQSQRQFVEHAAMAEQAFNGKPDLAKALFSVLT